MPIHPARCDICRIPVEHDTTLTAPSHCTPHKGGITPKRIHTIFSSGSSSLFNSHLLEAFPIQSMTVTIIVFVIKIPPIFHVFCYIGIATVIFLPIEAPFIWTRNKFHVPVSNRLLLNYQKSEIFLFRFQIVVQCF